MLLLGTCVAGCAAKPHGTVNASAPVPAPREYEELSASALVFDPPVAAGLPALELSRDLRQPSAFVGFDGPITTYYWIHTDDCQYSTWGGGGGGGGGLGSFLGDQYERRAVIDTTGVRYR